MVRGMTMTLDPYFQRTEGRNPAVVGKLRFFAFSHLPHPALRSLSERFAALAQALIDSLEDDPELSLALDKLREAKDRAVGLAAVTWLGRDEPDRPVVD